MFYVLVVGRLPFLSSKQEGLTHQERRDRLIAHINQGLGGTHRSDMKHLGSGENSGGDQVRTMAEHTTGSNSEIGCQPELDGPQQINFSRYPAFCV